MAHQAILVSSPGEALAYFQNANLNPRQTVIVESGPAPLPPAVLASGSTATITNETPQFIEIEINAAAAGYVILLDTYYPGWEAAVDGQPAPIYRANYIGRAIFVSAGRHIVQFEYRPLSFRIGVWLSLLTLTTLTVLAAITIVHSAMKK